MLRDIVVFLAGAEAFHTLSHLLLPYIIKLPLASEYVNVTPLSVNVWAVVINGAITIGLIVLASKMRR